MSKNSLAAEFIARLIVVSIGFIAALVPVALIVALVRFICWMIEG